MALLETCHCCRWHLSNISAELKTNKCIFPYRDTLNVAIITTQDREISMFMGATSGLTISFIAQRSPSPIIFSCRRVVNSIISMVVCYTTLQVISIMLYMYNQFFYYIILVFCRFAVCHADVYLYIDTYMWIVAVSSIHSNSYVSVIEVLE